MTLFGSNKVRDDVMDHNLDEKMAPSLGGVAIGREVELYVSPDLFFARTLVTEKMATLLRRISEILSQGKGGSVIVLSAFFGGGKTHTLLTLYHAVKQPRAILRATPENEDALASIKRAVEMLEEAGRVDVVVIDGYYENLAPSPFEPLDAGAYKIKTLWGYIAHCLGRFDLLSDLDDKLYPPSVEKLLEILRDRAVLILVDEIAEYIKKLYSSRDPTARDYAENVASFMSSLAIAVSMSRKAVLVISLPVEVGETEVKVDQAYLSIKDKLDEIVKRLKRHVSNFEEPVTPSNIPALLKTRIFEKIDERVGVYLQNELAKAYSEHSEIFGRQDELVLSVGKTYPFHPLYIKVILDILDKHEGLQKTRDLLRITRKVVREVLGDREEYGLIMPWHIDVTRDSIKNALLTGSYQGFTLAVKEDIVEKTSEYEGKKDLARITALALFASTFVYGGGFIPKTEMLPHERDLALMVYEPVYFNSKGWLPSDIIDASRWIAGNLVFVVKSPDTGRMWFTKWITPVKIVKERAKRVDDASAIKELLKHVEQTLSYSVHSKRTKRKPDVAILDAELSRVMRECEPIDDDVRKYIVIACLELPERIEDRRAKLEEIIYKTRSGSKRKFSNTIYVVFPSSREKLRVAIEKARELVACGDIQREGLLDKFIQDLPSDEAEIARDIYREKLREYMDEVTSSLYNSLIHAFDRIAYPSYDESKLASVVVERELEMLSESILERVERALTSSRDLKMRRELDFDTLEFYLGRVGVKLSEGDQERTVGDIIDYFYTNPKLPAVKAEAIIDALRVGVRQLKIGVRSKTGVLFKKIHEYGDRIPAYSEGEVVGLLDETDQILPWRTALLEQLKSLKRREIVEGREKLVEEYYVVVEGKEIPVEEVARNISKFDMMVLRERASIVRVRRKATVEVKVEEPMVKVEPGGRVDVKVKLRRVGPYQGIVYVDSDAGVVEKREFIVDDKFSEETITWMLERAPDKPGEYSYTIRVTGSEGRQLSVATITVKVTGLETDWVEGIPTPGSKISQLELEISGEPNLKPLEVLRRRIGGVSRVAKAVFELKVKTDEESSKITISLENTKVEDITDIFMHILRQYSRHPMEVYIRVLIKPKRGECIITPELTDEDSTGLSKARIKYRLQASC